MGWQPGEGRGTDAEPVPGPGVPGGAGASGASGAAGGPVPEGGPVRDERLSGFAEGGEWDACLPGPELASVLSAVGGPEWRCPAAEPDELIGVLRRVAAVESWASAAKLGVIRELIRRDGLLATGRPGTGNVPAHGDMRRYEDLPGRGGLPRHGDLPDAWSDSLNHELALALASSVGSAQLTALTAWELGARLPGIAALLADGTLTYAKAKLVAETFQLLSDADAARAEALLLPRLAGTTGKTWGQIMNLAARIANQVDPGLAERRRKAAVQHASRVRLFREQSGAAALSGRELPPDETLAAYASVTARAAQYQDSGAFPDARTDQLRTTAYLDLINGRPAHTRIALGHLSTGTEAPEAATIIDPDDPGPEDPKPGDGDPGGNEPPGGHGPTGSSPSNSGRGGSGESGDGDLGDEPQVGDGPGGGKSLSPVANTSRNSGPEHADTGETDLANGSGSGRDEPEKTSKARDAAGKQPAPAPLQGQPGRRPILTDLTFPLATLLGLVDRPGEAHGLGVLDPDLCRDLAELTAASPHSRICVTVTNPDGIAIGHGCGRTGRLAGPSPAWLHMEAPPPPVPLPAWVNLTITADRLSAMPSDVPGSPGTSGTRASPGWILTRRSVGGTPAPDGSGSAGIINSVGDSDWCGSWALTLPGGRELIVRIEPVPTYGCDHRHESPGYQPSDTLRHLVQVRDYALLTELTAVGGSISGRVGIAIVTVAAHGCWR
jgi:hypothetical protein